MSKLIVLVLVIVLVLWLMKGRGRGAEGRRDGAPPAPGGKAPQPMVACAHCGVHLPRSDALLLGEQAYCCAAHRDAGARRG